jgi:hypothetical protein
MRLPILIFGAVAAGLTARAQIQIFESSPWADLQVAAQGGNGVVYVADSQPSHWGEWRPDGNQFHLGWSGGISGNARAIAFETDVNGQVHLIWERNDDRSIAVDFRNVSGYPYLQRIQGPGSLTRVFVDSRTNVWITEAALNLWQQTRAKRREKLPVHTITTEELYPGGDPANRLPVSLVEDARGRVWFWSNCQFGGDERGAVRGVLIADGGNVTHHPGLAGVVTNRISVIAPMGGSNFWMAVRAAGIFSVNLDTLAGERVAEPETNVFQSVQQMFPIGDDFYVIAGGGVSFNREGLTGSLWRRRSGRWQKLLGGLDSSGTTEQFAQRHHLVTTNGLWLAGFGTGGWFVPHNDGAPIQADWRVDLPFTTIDRWFRWKEGQLLGLQFGRGGFIADESVLLAGGLRRRTAQIFQPARPFVQTGDGRVFGFFRGQERTLREWAGNAWRAHPLPDNVQLGSHELLTDSMNRLWWIHLPYGSPDATPSYIFDPARGKFETFSGYPAALQSQRARPPALRVGRDEYFAPKFSPDGRICFEDKFLKLYYYNGRTWRDWRKTDIGGRDMDLMVHPFFDADGHLGVWLDKTLWRFTELEGWRAAAASASAETGFENRAGAQPPLRPAALARADSVVADRLGTFWLTAERQLFRAAFGLTHEAFAADEAQPFIDGRKLLEALTDNSGNTFLRTSVQGRDEYVLVPARAPLPDTVATLIQNDEDGMTLRLSANFKTPRFTWRSDDGSWSEAGTNQTLRLDDLASGKHRIQVVAVDRWVQADPTPAEISVEVKGDAEPRLQKWIAQLGDKDFARREAAIKLLARQPELALPALRAALQRETDRDRRWWLEAAIQQCEQARSKLAP